MTTRFAWTSCEERVRQALLNKTGKEVFLRGDGGVQLQDLLEVMDRLKNAGVEKVGIVAKLPENDERAPAECRSRA